MWFFLFRHGETDFNAEGRFQGHLDVPLGARGAEQIRRLIAPLRRVGIEAVLASDLSRARESGRIVAESLDVPLFEDARLREAHLGEAQGLTMDEIVARFGQTHTRLWRSPDPTDADVAYPGGETGVEIATRSMAALEEFALRQPLRSVAIATHGGVLRRLFQLHFNRGGPNIPIPNGILYAVARTGSGTWAFPGMVPLAPQT